MRLVAAAGLLATLASAPPSGADEPARVQVGATLGYAFPAGSLERGSRTSDVTFGAPFLQADGSYRVHPLVSAGGGISYGTVLPTLCATASDCASSLGRDVTVSFLARLHMGQWKAFEPSVDGSIGYEWLATSFSNDDVTSQRLYRGFAGGLAADALLRASPRFAFGLRLEVRGGSFHRTSLVAPGVDVGGPTDGNLIHLWPAVGLRAIASF
jgi:hypothetical protein